MRQVRSRLPQVNKVVSFSLLLIRFSRQFNKECCVVSGHYNLLK